MTNTDTSRTAGVGADGGDEDGAGYWAHFGLDAQEVPPAPTRRSPTPEPEAPAAPDLDEVPEDDATSAKEGATELEHANVPDPHHRGFARAALTLSAVVVLLAVAVGVLLPNLISAHQAQARRADVAEVTRQMMTNLVTLRFDSAQADVDRLLDGATGSFREQFGGQAGAFRDVLEQGRVVSTGQVTEVGVQEVTEENATALAAVRARVANSDAPEGQERNYRMRVTLQHQDDRWLVADVEFVP